MAKVDLRGFVISLIATAAIAGCAGGGGGPSVPPANPMAASGSVALPAGTRSAEVRQIRIALDKIEKVLTLPPTARMTERVTLPTNDAPPGASLEVTISNALPSNVPRIPARKSEAFMAFTLEASTDVTLHGIPKFSVRLASKPENNGTLHAWAFSPQSGWRDFGPMTVSGNVITFGGNQKNLKLQRGVVYAAIPFTADSTITGCPTPSPTPSMGP